MAGVAIAATLAWGPGWIRERPYAADSYSYDEAPAALTQFGATLRSDHSNHAAQAASIIDQALAAATFDHGSLTINDQADLSANGAPTFIWVPIDHATQMPEQSFGAAISQVEVLLGRTWANPSVATVVVNFDDSDVGYSYAIDPGAAMTVANLLYDRIAPSR